MSLMIFIFVCFSGLFIMFFFILRGQEKIHAALREELAMLRTHMRQIEAKISGDAVEEQTNPQTPQHATLPSAPTQSDHPTAINRPSITHRPDIYDPPDSLSMDAPTAASAPSSGLDLHFDPQQDFRR